MTHSRDIERALAHLEMALEASCGALMAVEAMLGRATQVAREFCAVRGQIAQTIGVLRHGIAELRAGQGEPESVLAFGFVLEAEGLPPRGPQPRPRRTA